jgi:nucleoside-diphosphate-sugar epimerase
VNDSESNPSAPRKISPRQDSTGGRVLVTGAGGFIGAALSAALRANGSEVVGVDRVAVPADGVVQGDTTAPAPWEHLLDGVDVVVHTAAVVSNAVDLDEQWRVNVLGTRRVIEAAARHGVRRVVHLSSVRAFSDNDFPDGVTEDRPVRPDGNPYVDTKIASEHVVLQAHAAGEVDVVVVRPGDVYGPGSQPWVLKPLALIRSGQFLLPAMGKGIHSPVYIDDLVAGLLLAASHPDAPGQVFTIAGPRAVPCTEYFGHLVRFAGRRGPWVAPTPVAVALAATLDRANRLRRRRSEVNAVSVRYLARAGTYSSDKARRVLGYEPTVDLDEGMRRTQEWLRAHEL